MLSLLIALAVCLSAQPTCAPTPPPVFAGSTDGCNVRGTLCSEGNRCCTKGLICGAGGYCQSATEPTITAPPSVTTQLTPTEYNALFPPTGQPTSGPPTETPTGSTAPPTCAPTPPPVFTGSTNGCNVRGVLCSNGNRCCATGLVCGAGGYCQSATEPTLTAPPSVIARLTPTEHNQLFPSPTPPPPPTAPVELTLAPTNGQSILKPSLLVILIVFLSLVLWLSH